MNFNTKILQFPLWIKTSAHKKLLESDPVFSLVNEKNFSFRKNKVDTITYTENELFSFNILLSKSFLFSPYYLITQ